MTTFYILVFLSMLAHFVSKIYDATKKYKKSFSIVTWIIQPRNYLYLILSLLFAIMLSLSAIIKLDITMNLGVIEFRVAYLIAILFGWMPASIFHALLKKIFPNKRN